MRATKAMLSALKWLKNRNGDGVFDRRGVLVAGGEKAPVMRSTWSKLDGLGWVELHCDRRRLRVSSDGHSVDLVGIEESEAR